jgi:cation diffusion facilitator family transporter
MAKSISDIRVVATSFVVSILDVAINLVISVITGSTVVLAQALQGLSDLVTGGILYKGVRRSSRQADSLYQFGHGREIFFWVLMAGIVMFVGTGGMSVYFGAQQFISPQPVESVWLGIGTLLFGLATNGYAFSLSVKRLNRLDPSKRWHHQLLHSSIVETKATFLIDLLGTTSAIFGFIALLLYAITGNARFDGLGSIIIGLSMMCVAVMLVNDVRSLIVGKAVESHVADRIIGSAQTVEGVQSVLDLRTMYLGSARLLVIIEVHVQDGLDTDQIEKIVDNIKVVVQVNVPQVHHIQVEIETPD